MSEIINPAADPEWGADRLAIDRQAFAMKPGRPAPLLDFIPSPRVREKLVETLARVHDLKTGQIALEQTVEPNSLEAE